jgi:hypothetical protein
MPQSIPWTLEAGPHLPSSAQVLLADLPREHDLTLEIDTGRTVWRTHVVYYVVKADRTLTQYPLDGTPDGASHSVAAFGQKVFVQVFKKTDELSWDVTVSGTLTIF